jgi:hypothetical protein
MRAGPRGLLARLHGQSLKTRPPVPAPAGVARGSQQSLGPAPESAVATLLGEGDDCAAPEGIPLRRGRATLLRERVENLGEHWRGGPCHCPIGGQRVVVGLQAPLELSPDGSSRPAGRVSATPALALV